MKRKRCKWVLWAAGLLTAVLGITAAHGQSSDAILNKLVEKGILTKQEADELKKESNKEFTKAYQAKSGLPDWVTSLKLNGDFRPRYEGDWSDNPIAVQRDRFRYRVRFGITATLVDHFEIGFRLASGDPVSGFGTQTGNPLSGSSTLQDNGTRKYLYLDLAYAKWTSPKGEHWSGNVTFGKMENPFGFTYVVFDPDYMPEGLSSQLAYNINEHHALKLSAGGFILDELSASARDPFLIGGQLVWDAKWSNRWQSQLGVGALAITSQDSLTNGAVPNVNRGNTRTGGTGILAESFTPIVGDAALTYTLDSFSWYKAPFPIRLGGEYLYNPGADSKNVAYLAGVTFGKAGKKGLWEVSYNYRYIGADAWYEELPDDDFHAFYPVTTGGIGSGFSGGTNLRGHIVKASYSPFDSVTLNVLYYAGELIHNPDPADSSTRGSHILVDAVWRF
jgi:hypothetical protein